MKRVYLFLIFLSTFANSESLLTVYDSINNKPNFNRPKLSYCITDTYSPSGQNILFQIYNINGKIENKRINKDLIYSIENGYFYNKSTFTCEIIETNTNDNSIISDENGLIMGLTEQNFHLSMAFYGVALSFLMSIAFILSL